MRNFLVVVVVLVGGLIISYFINQNDRKKLIEKLKIEEYFGVVDSVFLDPDSRMQPKVMLTSGMKASVQNDIYQRVKEGDIMFKNAGSLKYFIIHQGDTVVYYQEDDGKEVRN